MPGWAGDLVAPVSPGSAGCHLGARPIGGRGGRGGGGEARPRGILGASPLPWGALSCACISFSAAAVSMSCELAQGQGGRLGCTAPAAAVGGL